jgi:hypothetical protein
MRASSASISAADDDVAVGHVAEVELHARAEAPFQRHLVDGDRAFAAVHRRMVVIGRVEMGAVVGGDLQALHRPAFAAGQICSRFSPGKNIITCSAVWSWVWYSIFGSMIGGSEAMSASSATEMSTNRRGMAVSWIQRPGIKAELRCREGEDEAEHDQHHQCEGRRPEKMSPSVIEGRPAWT